MRRGVGLVVASGLAVASCAHLDPAIKYAEDLCKTQPMVGYVKGAKLELDASHDKFESAKVSLSAERYEKLAQELHGYTAEWESLNQSTQRVCKDWALCQYHFGGSPGACDAARAHRDEREDAARNFLERMKKLDLGIEKPGITSIVPVTKDSKLSGKEFKLDITVRNPTKTVLQLDKLRLDFYGPRGGMLAAVTEVSGTYTILIDPDTGKAIVRAPGSQEIYEAYAWFPSGCNDRFIVKSPIWQTIKPNESDRFIVKVVFPDNECMKKATFTDVKVSLTFNGSETMDSEKISLLSGSQASGEKEEKS